MKMHLISTGQVKITRNWQIGKRQGLARLANSLLDHRFTDWLPIYCAVIEHPEGLIVIDTGIPANANAPLYFPPHMRLVQRAAPFQMTPAEEIGPQMRAQGLNPADVRRVVLTHLHQDHEGGLFHFPQAEFMVSRDEWTAAQGWRGRMNGYLNQRWFAGFAPTLIDFTSGVYQNFSHSQTLTDAGDIHLLPTPGHSAGHLSVLIEQSDHAILVAGDAAYTQAQLLADQIDGVGPDPQAQHETHQQIITLASKLPLVFLPSHDPDSARRLEQRQTLPAVSASTGAI
ncbi:MAG: N-acyl homoserine lactonase family protein [Anaerolineae bacterium]|nr:N-acyl homoserine lactonase family protein [Anaerolineae bacterium]